jgi:hypothetical protein
MSGQYGTGASGTSPPAASADAITTPAHAPAHYCLSSGRTPTRTSHGSSPRPAVREDSLCPRITRRITPTAIRRGLGRAETIRPERRVHDGSTGEGIE